MLSFPSPTAQVLVGEKVQLLKEDEAAVLLPVRRPTVKLNRRA